MRTFLVLASLCAVIAIANGNNFLRTLKSYQQQKMEEEAQVSYILIYHKINIVQSFLQVQGAHTTEEILASAICQTRAGYGRFA